MIVAYPMSNKAKSLELCRVFISGCGGVVANASNRNLLPGNAFFYGVDESNVHLFRQARTGVARDWYYCDNAYFDSTRQQYFRITRNRLQHSGYGSSDMARFRKLNIQITPWKDTGKHIVVCPQSDEFMRTIVGFNGDWCAETVAALASLTDRPVKLRTWGRDKNKLAATLAADLMDAYALVTWSSAAAVTAVLAGVPVVVLSADCAAMPMSGAMSKLEALPRRDRSVWSGVLADNQWTLDEFKDGTAWKMLNG